MLVVSRLVVTGLEGASISLKSLKMNHLFCTPEQFGELMVSELVVQLIGQVTKAVMGQLAAKVIGKTKKEKSCTRKAREFDSLDRLLACVKQ